MARRKRWVFDSDKYFRAGIWCKIWLKINSSPAVIYHSAFIIIACGIIFEHDGSFMWESAAIPLLKMCFHLVFSNHVRQNSKVGGCGPNPFLHSSGRFQSLFCEGKGQRSIYLGKWVNLTFARLSNKVFWNRRQRGKKGFGPQPVKKFERKVFDIMEQRFIDIQRAK